jgi:ubiquinone/menaquinone biosynthesis C-methylase UbiE
VPRSAPDLNPSSNLRTYQRIAPFYDLLDFSFEHGRYRLIRPLLFEGLTGQILDAGIGTGRNIRYYPPAAEVVGLDLSPAMLACANRRAARLGRAVKLQRGDVTSLDFADQSFDAVVASFLFCVIPTSLHGAAMRELARVLKPGGQIRLLDYVRPKGGVRAAMARLWEPWIAWAYGASFDRHPKDAMADAGLEILDERYVVSDLIRFTSARNP